MVTIAQSTVNWRNTHTHMDRTHSHTLYIYINTVTTTWCEAPAQWLLTYLNEFMQWLLTIVTVVVHQDNLLDQVRGTHAEHAGDKQNHWHVKMKQTEALTPDETLAPNDRPSSLSLLLVVWSQIN